MVASSPKALAMEVTFILVPENAWAAGELGEESWLDGRIHLFRSGAFVPEMEVAAEQAIAIPPGTWHWIAEADGWVSVDSGTLQVASVEERASRRLVLPVVPACRAVLDPAADWEAVQRIDLISIDRQAVYPVTPRWRSEQWVPLGEVVSYGVGLRGLIGLERVGACQIDRDLRVPLPQPPRPDRFDLMVHAVLEEEASEDSATDRHVAPASGHLQLADNSSVGPLATVATEGRTTFLFDEVAAGPATLALQHPLYRTHRRDIDGTGGSASEIGPLELKSRRDVTLSIDYRPARSHRNEHLELWYCGASGEVRAWGTPACQPTDVTMPLEAGVHTYTFDGLDDGLYMMNAVVDDVELVALQNGINFFLDPSSEDVPRVPPTLLAEFHLYGQILLESEPVPGEVRVRVGATTPWAHDLHAATDDELFYHLYYFGQRAGGSGSLPGDERRSPVELLGLPFGALIDACDLEGHCRRYGQSPVVRGGGRLDLDLGSDTGISLHVADAVSRAPLAGAEVWFQHGEPRLTFYDGEARGGPAVSSGPIATDRSGRAARRNLPPGTMTLAVRKLGYRDAHLEVAVPETGVVRQFVRLEPSGPASAASRLVLTDGRALSGAFLMGIDEEGRRTGCTAISDSQGGVDLETRPCGESRDFLLFHPRAAIRRYSRHALTGVADAEIDPAPHPPLRVRATTVEGVPIMGEPTKPEIDSATIGLDDLLLVHGRANFFLFSATAEGGLATLHGVDPAMGGTLKVRFGDMAGEIDLRGYRPGEIAEVVLDER